jgi:hypothetical protein
LVIGESLVTLSDARAFVMDMRAYFAEETDTSRMR